ERRRDPDAGAVPRPRGHAPHAHRVHRGSQGSGTRLRGEAGASLQRTLTRAAAGAGGAQPRSTTQIDTAVRLPASHDSSPGPTQYPEATEQASTRPSVVTVSANARSTAASSVTSTTLPARSNPGYAMRWTVPATRNLRGAGVSRAARGARRPPLPRTP